MNLLWSAVCLGMLMFSEAMGSPLETDALRMSDVLVSIESVPNISEFRRANPDLTVVPLRSVRTEGAAGRLQIVYTLGSRNPSDRLVGLSSDNKAWPSPQDVTLNLQYPTAGVGAVVTYVEVVVNQSTANGRGYVVSGGVGQRQVRLVVEAYGTTYFNYTGAIYGL